MGNVMKSLKKTWLKGMEAIGNTASNIADNAKYKVTEMNLETRRREILADFGSIAYEMWQRGETFPPALEAQLKQLNALDEQLTVIRAQRIAAAREAKLAEEAADAAARKADAPAQAEEDEIDAQALNSPVPESGGGEDSESGKSDGE